MLQSALAAAEELAGEGIEAAVLDLRTVKPLDTDQILEAVKATGKALIVHAANRMMGCGAEVAALIAEECFEYLDAPVRRLGGLDTPVPFSPSLEQAYRPDADRIAAAARDLAVW